MGLLGAYTAGTYVDSMWGVAQFSLSNESPCTCAFVGDKSLWLVSIAQVLDRELIFVTITPPPPPKTIYIS